MAENIIELEHVDAGYPGAVILRDVSFEVKRGEVFILLGGSGCGKSTIMKHMIGLNPILAGTLRVAGMEWSAKTRDALFHKIGVMYQSGALFGSMTCLENVMLPLEEFTRLKRAARRDRAMELLADVGLADAAGKLPSEISGGMRKRAAIARAMALDRETKGMTFVVVTHELPSIFKIADRAAMFDKARHGMIALGSPSELREKSEDAFVRKFFNRGESHG